jgi:hypothetical protein
MFVFGRRTRGSCAAAGLASIVFGAGCTLVSGVDDLHLAPPKADSSIDVAIENPDSPPSDRSSPDRSAPDRDAGPDPIEGGEGGPLGPPTLGGACDMQGALGCNGNRSDTRVICDASHVWVANGTCASGQLCDSTPGPDVGTCKPIVAGCAGQQPGAVVCDGAIRRVCGLDLVTSTSMTCASPTLCQLGTGPACAACADGDHQCEQAVLKKCNAAHTGFDVQETCATAMLCNAAAGACTANACVPNQYRCTGNNLEKCNAAQNGFDFVMTCQPGLCDANGKQCDVCVGGTKSCANASTAQTCSMDGQSQVPTSCTGPTPYCTNGQCVQCTAPSQCPDPGNPCLSPTCGGNVCGTTPNTGATCSLPNATATCNGAGVCTKQSCNMGFGDCTAAAGCETNVLTNGTNCGACGHDCLGSGCTTGLCNATQIGTEKYGSFPTSVAVVGQTLYWITTENANGGGIWSCPTSGCPTTLVNLTTADSNPFMLLVDSRVVFWTDLNLGVVSCPFSGCGTAPDTLSAMAGTGGFARDSASHLFWADSNNKVVKTYNTSRPGSATGDMATATSFPTSVAVDGTSLYWLELSSTLMAPVSADGRVMKCTTSCTNNAAAFASSQRLSIESVYNPNTLVVAGGNVYWVVTTNQMMPISQIMTCPVGGCGAGSTVFGDVGAEIAGLYSDGTYLYWGSKDMAFNVMRRKLDRSAPAEKFANAAGPATAFTSDGSYVYWLETNSYIGIGPHYLMKAPK